MQVDALERAQRLGFRRPTENNGIRLWYREGHVYDEKKYRCLEPLNCLTQVRLYRWFRNRDPEHVQMVEKNWLLNHLFSDTNLINKTRIGRILRIILQYHPNFQRHAPNRQYWRWGHKLEVVYGLEYLMLTWMPTYNRISTAEEFEEELEGIVQDSPEDDVELFKFLSEEYVGRGYYLQV